MQGDQRLCAQVQHQVKRLTQGALLAAKLDGAGGTTGLHTTPVRRATRQINLVVQANRALGAGFDTGITAGAQIEVDRVVLCPLEGEGTQPAGQRRRAARQHREAALLHAPRRGIRTRGENRHIQRVAQQQCGALGLRQGPHHQQAACTFVGDGGHRLGVRQACRCQQRGEFGGGTLCVAAPAAGLADVDKPDDRYRTFGLLGQCGEELFFLGAGHHHVVA